MKITDIKTWAVTANWRSLIYLQVYTDEGVSGVGEASIERNVGEALAAIENLKAVLIGANPMEITKLWQQMYMYPIWPVGSGSMAAIGGIEIALWDIAGKVLGVPVYQLLGGKVRDRIRTYANGWFQSCHSIGEFADAAADVVQRGYQALMWDPFGAVDQVMNGVEERKAIECVRAVRRAIGPEVDMAIEFHFKFDMATALRLMRKLEEFDPYWYEDPIRLGWHNTSMWEVLARSTRIALCQGGGLHGRFGHQHLIKHQLVQHLKPDLIHSGGIAETARVASMGEIFGMTCSPHVVGGIVNRAAAMHFAAATPNFLMLEHLIQSSEHPAANEVSSKPLPDQKDGYLPLPEGPGLGVDLDYIEPMARRYAYEPGKDAPKLGLGGLTISEIHPMTEGDRGALADQPAREWLLEYS
jgi:galactonate dehydratase